MIPKINGASEEEQTMLEKVLLAYYLYKSTWDGKKYRRSWDECFNWLITDKEELSQTPYDIFDLLGGRVEDNDLVGFILKNMGDPDPQQIEDKLKEKYREIFEPKMQASRSL